MAPCASCIRHLLTDAPGCPRCRPAASTDVATRIRSLGGSGSGALSRGLRRLFITLLVLIVGFTWLAAASYAWSHRAQETADQRAVQCGMIEEDGEEYIGELADCRNRLAYLRLIERQLPPGGRRALDGFHRLP